MGEGVGGRERERGRRTRELYMMEGRAGGIERECVREMVDREIERGKNKMGEKVRGN